MRRRFFLSLPLIPVLRAADTLEAFGIQWSVPLLQDWRVQREDGVEVLRLATPRPMEASPRRPFQYALAATPPLSKVTLECETRRDPNKKAGSVILVYAWKGPDHFNYAHLSGDSASEQPVHNGIFHVYGGDRVRISSDRGPGALASPGWHAARLTYDASTGVVDVAVDGAPNPSLRAVDLSLGAGKVGIGSFFDTADFRDVKLTFEPAS